MAQAQVRLEFAAGTYDEAKAPLGQLFNEYFGGGMAGLVFQELREARALAYSAWAHFFTPSRPEDENILVEHSLATFGSGAKEAVLAVHTKKDGLIWQTETGATPI